MTKQHTYRDRERSAIKDGASRVSEYSKVAPERDSLNSVDSQTICNSDADKPLTQTKDCENNPVPVNMARKVDFSSFHFSNMEIASSSDMFKYDLTSQWFGKDVADYFANEFNWQP